MDIKDFHRLTVDQLLTVLKDSEDANVGDVVICGGCFALVTEVVIWPPNASNRPKAPIRDDLSLIEVRTTNGTRWHGTDESFIYDNLDE